MVTDPLRAIERASKQVVKQRYALQCGAVPLSEITKPKYMTSREFNRRLRALSRNEHKLTRLLVAYCAVKTDH